MMTVSGGYLLSKPGSSEILRKTTITFTDLIENEITSLGKVMKTQFGLMVKFSIIRNSESQYMELCFKQNELVILGINNEAMINDVLSRFIDQVKDEIEPEVQSH